MDEVMKLIEEYKPLLNSFAWKYKTIGYDDCYQEAVLGLIIAHMSFDPSRGTFGAFAKVVIQNRLNKLYRVEVKQPIPVDFSEPANEDEEGSIPQRFLAVDDEEFGKVELIESLKVVSNRLGKIERMILKMKMKDNDITQMEMAKEVGVSQSTIARVIKKIAGEM